MVEDNTTPALSNDENMDSNSRRSRSGGGIAFLALLLSLAAVALAGWLYWQQLGQSDPDQQLTALDARLSDLTTDNQAMEQRIQRLASALDQLQTEQAEAASADPQRGINQLRQRVASLNTRLGALEPASSGYNQRLAAVEQSLADVAAIRIGNDKQLARAEIAYLLRLADERLQLFSDRDAAVNTLQLADRQLAALNDPLLTAVRQQIQQDIQVLGALELPDPVKLSGVLLALEQNISSWPAKAPASATAERTDPGSGLWGRTKSAIKGLVKVQRQNDLGFLTLEEADRLRERMRLELQVARVAAIQGNQALFQNAVIRLSDWLRQYFDSEAGSVALALETLEQLQQTSLQQDLPDIGSAYQQLQAMLLIQPAAASLDAATQPPGAAEILPQELDNQLQSSTVEEATAEETDGGSQ